MKPHALDNNTEDAVMEALNNLQKNNVVMIAHRLSTLKLDIIYILEKVR